MTTNISILNGKGDTSLTWDHDDPIQIEAMRTMVADLASKGYQFFLVNGKPADTVAAGQGHLVVKKLTAQEIVEPVEESKTPDTPLLAIADTPEPTKRRGRAKKGEQNVVAVRPVRGG
jgi:hypothetical protein